MIDYAKKSSVPVVVHLDHGKSIEAIRKTIEIGFISVMIDDQNVILKQMLRRLTRYQRGCLTCLKQ
ncbi:MULTISPECIES: class II fructose-bisphosphate aldolase [Bacillaceae]|jgi:fructose-bisphosphate aldolase class II|uniref:class II fructose-bisphosphate aldolase n=1 Tax=Bacillaceae TaxID=186817 RepID=UPI000D54AFF8|nr:hypothetical protein CQJ30_17415 [Caldibacillus thermoamylovorans]